jgi:hypothetical protein
MHLAVIVAAAVAATGAVIVYRKLPHAGGHSEAPTLTGAPNALSDAPIAAEMGVPTAAA